MMKHLTVLLLAVLLILALAACGGVPGGLGAGPGADDAAAAETETADTSVAVEVQTVERVSMATESTVSGAVAAGDVTDAYPGITAQVQSVPVDVGDRVYAGQVICILDTSDYRDSLVTLQSSYNTTAASYNSNKLLFAEQIAQAQKNVSDTKALLAIGAASQAQLDAAELTLLQLTTTRDTTLRQLEDGMTSISANIKTLQSNIAKGSVTAPITGIVTAVNATVGAYCSPSYPIATIADSSSLQVKVAVSEALMPKLAVGQHCTVAIGAVTDQTYTGTIRTIAPTPNPVTNLYDIEIDLPNGTGATAGLFASVTFATDATYDAVAVPTEAIQTSGDTNYVFLVGDDGLAHKVYVTRGQTNGGITEITDGLNGGERLVVSGQTYLDEGTVVRVVSGTSAADTTADAAAAEGTNP